MNGELEQLGERIAEQAAHLDAAMHRLLTDLREFDARGGWRVQGASSCAHWLAWRVGWDPVTARDHVRVARKLAEFALIDDALRRGEVSYSKVRALLRVATPANEALLLDHARLMTASQLEKLCRKYALVQRHGEDDHPQVDEQRRHVRRRDLEDGMVKIEAVLHPEEAELVWTMLDHAASRLAREAAAAAATGEMVGQDSAESAGSAGAGSRDAEATDSDDAELGDMESTGSMDAGSRDSETPARAGTESRDKESVHSAEGGTGWLGDASYGLLGSRASLADAPVPHRIGPGSAHDAGAAVCPDADAHGTIEPAARCRLSGADAAAETTAAQEIGDSAEASRSILARSPDASSEPTGARVSERSLLDRLLEESDALRSDKAAAAEGADATPSDQLAPTSSEARAMQRMTQLTGRNASVLRGRAAAARTAFNRADALVELAQGYLRGDRPARSPIEVMLTIPVSGLRDELADPVEVGEMGESFVSREAARRLSCDAGVVEIVEDEHGTPLSVGRKRRTIAGALRRALYRRDRSCTFPGCTNRMFLESHHIRHWADGGETSLSNAILLCGLHHRCVHELGYTLELGPDQRPRFRDPQGRIVAVVPEAPTLADLGWPRIRAANEPLGIDAGAIAGPWDGTPVDYSRIVGHLLAADGLA